MSMQAPPPRPPQFNQQSPMGGMAAGPVEFGGFWIRFVAALVDGIIIGIPIWIVMFLIGGSALTGVAAMGDNPDPAAAMAAMGSLFLVFPIALVIAWLYEALMTSSEGGATVGKRILGLKVVRDGDGARLSFGRATGRYFAKTIISNIVPFAIGYIMAGFTDRKRSLHDMVAGTVVIKR